MKALTPSMVSRLPKLTVWAHPSASSAWEKLVAREFESIRLVICRARGGPVAKRWAQPSTKSSTSSSGKTRFTIPSSRASWAERISASSASSLALCMPTRRGSSHVPPKSTESPRRAKISEKRALSPATTRSQPRARFIPAPTASPVTLARVGFGRVCRARAAAFTSCMAFSGCPPSTMLAPNSAPAQKAPPAPVITRTRSLSVSRTSRKICSRGSHMGPAIAFFTWGRLSVSVTTPFGPRSTWSASLRFSSGLA